MTDRTGADNGASPPTDMVDWDFAASTARTLVGPGPEVTADQAEEVVAQLKTFIDDSEGLVREVTGLDGSGSAGRAPLFVVDRAGWSTANTESMRTLVAPLMEKMGRRRTGGFLDQIGPKVTGLEAGAVLAFLSTKVLGQFDPFWTGDDAGRLLLVAPNIVQVERELKVDTRDFRLWVCLHEETHRVQFTAVPWLRDHLRERIGTLTASADVDASEMWARLREVGRALVDSARHPGEGPSLLDVIQTPDQKAVVDELTAVMSLLEGHADIVMDRVGPTVIPSVATIRAKFQKRRAGAGGFDRIARRVLGLDAKMRQYRDGAEFCRQVIARVGMDGFNRVWTSPETLPSRTEIMDPQSWVARVHPDAAPAPAA